MASDLELQDLLTKFELKYKRAVNKSPKDKTIYDTTGLVKDGKVISVTEFKKIFKDKINYGITMLEERLDKNYMYKVNKQFKDNTSKMLYNMGLADYAERIKQMKVSDFLKLGVDEVWNFVSDVYKNTERTALAETVATGSDKGTKPKYTKYVNIKDLENIQEKLGF